MMQIIAMTTMLVDHVGLLFFPEADIFRIVGRIAFPLYSWFLVQGYKHTRDRKKYMKRLFWIACLSQIPYSLALQQWELNVIFTLFLSLIGLLIMDCVSSERLKTLLIILVFSTAIVVPMDYGLYGVLLIFIFRYFNSWKMVGFHLLLDLIFFILYGSGYWIQMFSIAGTLLIASHFPYRSVYINKWVYRSFYPVHLGILFLLYVWIQRF